MTLIYTKWKAERRGYDAPAFLMLRTCIAGIDAGHEGLQFLVFLVCDFCFGRVIFVVEKRREHIVNLCPLGVSHGEGGCIHALGYKLMGKPVALAVAAYNAVDFPPPEFVQELLPGESNLAHEELVQFVGGF